MSVIVWRTIYGCMKLNKDQCTAVNWYVWLTDFQYRNWTIFTHHTQSLVQNDTKQRKDAAITIFPCIGSMKHGSVNICFKTALKNSVQLQVNQIQNLHNVHKAPFSYHYSNELPLRHVCRRKSNHKFLNSFLSAILIYKYFEFFESPSIATSLNVWIYIKQIMLIPQQLQKV